MTDPVRKAFLDEYSLSPLPLTLLFNDQPVCCATGFFVKEGGKFFLVSNWHVFSGRNPATGQPRHSQGAIPNRLAMPMHLKDKIGEFRSNIISDLVDSKGSALWRQHPKGQIIDVAVLPIGDMSGQLTAYELPRSPESVDLQYGVSSNVFILGFPLGLTHQQILPVWKRGSIASEPHIPVNDLPVFLVDSATREGMSGSPVLVRTFGYCPHEDGSIGMGGNYYTRFLGVYSGRYGADDEFAAQLGRVWHRSTITECIQDGVVGTFELS